jgi:hypothetical protein
MTADIVTLDNFRRNGSDAAEIPKSKREPPFVTFPDPLPKDWGKFWKASHLWWQREISTTAPSPESWRRALTPKNRQDTWY